MAVKFILYSRLTSLNSNKPYKISNRDDNLSDSKDDCYSSTELYQEKKYWFNIIIPLSQKCPFIDTFINKLRHETSYDDSIFSCIYILFCEDASCNNCLELWSFITEMVEKNDRYHYKNPTFFKKNYNSKVYVKLCTLFQTIMSACTILPLYYRLSSQNLLNSTQIYTKVYLNQFPSISHEGFIKYMIGKMKTKDYIVTIYVEFKCH